MSSANTLTVAALTLAAAIAPVVTPVVTSAFAASPSIGEPAFVDEHVKQPRGDKPVGPRPAQPAPQEDVLPPQQAPAAAAGRPAGKPAVGPRLAALVVPSRDAPSVRVTLERVTGIATAYQPELGFYCLVPKRGVVVGVPSLTVDHSTSDGENNVVRWASEPTALGCKASEIGVMTFSADADGAYRLVNTVGFAIVA